ncbi:MAG: hypothetical protein VX000_08475 [Myxococcota bacterium]|nr:hypothetical protein [Myxococcota bacterium]
MSRLTAEFGPQGELPAPGVSIEVAAGLQRRGSVTWGHLRFDRDGLRFRPQGAGGYVRLALADVEDVRFAAGGMLEVDAGGETWSWTGEGGRRIHGALQAARGLVAA